MMIIKLIITILIVGNNQIDSDPSLQIYSKIIGTKNKCHPSSKLYDMNITRNINAKNINFVTLPIYWMFCQTNNDCINVYGRYSYCKNIINTTIFISYHDKNFICSCLPNYQISSFNIECLPNGSSSSSYH